MRPERLSQCNARPTAAGTPAAKLCWEVVASPLLGRERAAWSLASCKRLVIDRTLEAFCELNRYGLYRPVTAVDFSDARRGSGESGNCNRILELLEKARNPSGLVGTTMKQRVNALIERWHHSLNSGTDQATAGWYKRIDPGQLVHGNARYQGLGFFFEEHLFS